MDFTSEIGIFLLGFFLGVGVIAIVAWYMNTLKLQQVKNPAEELLALKTEMQSIHSTIQQFSTAQAQKEGAFAAHIQNFLLASDKINTTAERLSNTLIRGGSQQQGTWGEFVLSNILETIGFREGEEYDTQKGYKNDEGNIQKPDVIIHMPGKRDVIIDSKVSLLAWDEYTNAVDEESKALALKRHVESIRKFIKDLKTDNYSTLYKIDTVDSILMFMPVEPAYHVLAKEGKNIIEEALKKKIAIVGPVNAGKSSLINYLSKKDVAIVSEIAGTTRDVIETHLNLDGYPVVVSDTAGIRESKNEIEKKGIKLSLKRAEEADLRLVVIEPKNVNFTGFLKNLFDENAILVINKSDLLDRNLDKQIKKLEHVLVSIKNNSNLDILISKIKKKLQNKFVSHEEILITRARHRQHLEKCIDHLRDFKNKNRNEEIDKAAEDLRLATRHLGMIVGKVDVEEILASIFNDFCIGK